MKKMAVPPKKAKSSASTRHTAEHPPLWVMLKAAITNLKDRKGSSRQAIIKYIQSNYKVQSTGKFKSAMKRCISKAVTEGKLLKTKGSFKLSSEEKTKKHKPAAGTVKKASKTKKSSAGGMVHKKPSKPKSLKKSKPKSAKAAGGAAASNLSAGATAAKKVKKTTSTKTKKAKPKTAPKK